MTLRAFTVILNGDPSGLILAETRELALLLAGARFAKDLGDEVEVRELPRIEYALAFASQH